MKIMLVAAIAIGGTAAAAEQPVTVVEVQNNERVRECLRHVFVRPNLEECYAKALAIGSTMVATDQPMAAYEVHNNEWVHECLLRAYTRLDIEKCYAWALYSAHTEMAYYLAAARKKFVESVNGNSFLFSEEDRQAAIAQLDDGQKDWERYRQSVCGAVYDNLQGGMVRNMKNLACQFRLTKLRTLAIWLNWHSWICDLDPLLPQPDLRRLEEFQ